MEAPQPRINNAFYDDLGEAWYKTQDHPVALLRAEARARNPWVLEGIKKRLGNQPCRVLDIGCGGGFLANEFARAGQIVTGVDLSLESLRIARRADLTGAVRYEPADAYNLPFAPGSFDVVCAMDLLEHVDNPGQVIQEAARVLRPGGLLFLYTFNRTLLAWLIAIKGIEWFIRNAPKNMHAYSLFIRPEELQVLCAREGLSLEETIGVRPVFSWAFWKTLITGRVSENFSFTFTPSLRVGYLAVYCKAKGPGGEMPPGPCVS